MTAATRRPAGSIIIPAHNEAAVLGRGLQALLADLEPGLFEIVVVANGCSDDTLSVAKSFHAQGVTGIEIPQASKTAAIRAGEGCTSTFPRLYLDADVEVTSGAVRAVFEALRTQEALAASPRMHLDLRSVSLPARLYLQTWASLPIFKEHYVGFGCYAITALGRSRFGDFPDVLNDDQFVNRIFSDSEKLTLTSHHVTIVPPRTLRAMVKRSLRVRAGRRLLIKEAIVTHSSARTYRFLFVSLIRPRRWPSIAVFAATQVCVIAVARCRRLLGRDGTWLRDETSRLPGSDKRGIPHSQSSPDSISVVVGDDPQ